MASQSPWLLQKLEVESQNRGPLQSLPVKPPLHWQMPLPSGWHTPRPVQPEVTQMGAISQALPV